MPFCDGCGAQANDSHVRERIERLELTTRFRPIHIHVLLLDAAPPIRLQDYFYRAASNRNERSAAAREYFDELAKCAGFASGSEVTEEVALAEFQRRGFFLAYAVECPVDSPDELNAPLTRLGPTLAKRVERSYKPKYVVPISQAMAQLIPLLESSGSSERLVLDGGRPFVAAALMDQNSRAEVVGSLGDRIAQALSLRG